MTDPKFGFFAWATGTPSPSIPINFCIDGCAQYLKERNKGSVFGVTNLLLEKQPDPF